MCFVGPQGIGYGQEQMALLQSSVPKRDRSCGARVRRHWQAVFFGICLGFLPLAGLAAETPTSEFEEIAKAIVRIDSRIPADARTAEGLGRERAGNGVVVDGAGLVLTIGYVILEAKEVTLTTAAGKQIPADVVAYDHETGFGLVRALAPIDAKPIRIGDSATLSEGDPVLVMAHGGRAQTAGVYIVSLREFAGYWEYLLERAIFTAPPHPNWGGAALIDREGRLVGIGSLLVGDAMRGERTLPGNMFVPIALLKPVMADMLSGTNSRPRRPWLGMFSSDSEAGVVVTRVAPGGPAQRAGVRAGDVVDGVAGERPRGVADMYRKIWALGGAGVEVPLRIQRQGVGRDITVPSGDRYRYLKLRHAF